VEGEGRIVPVPVGKLDRLSICQPRFVAISGGERLQLKANARTVAGKKVANGELVTVREVSSDGRILLADGRELPADYRQFTHGYAVTSYASQGKTVDHVLFSDSASRPATNDQQWYVTISRGRRGIAIFTSDKGQLRENITRSGRRPFAIDLVPPAVKRTWFHRLMVQRFGARAAQQFFLAKRHRMSESLRNRNAMRQGVD
jgi:hypothetical protein